MRALALLLLARTAFAEPPRERVLPSPRERPVGGQFLSDQRGWQTRLPALDFEGPPTLFLLSADELAGARYGWQLPALATSLLQEMLDLMAAGCADRCAPTLSDARAVISALLDDPGRWTPARPVVSRRQDEDGAGSRRTIGLIARRGRDAVRVECTCHSLFFGMRDWEDVTTCGAVVSRDQKRVIEYAPRIEVRSAKTGLVRLDRYEQTLTLADGALTLTSGFDYQRAGQGPYEKTTVRGEIRRSGALAAMEP